MLRTPNAKLLTNYIAGYSGKQDTTWINKVAPIVKSDVATFEYERFYVGAYRNSLDSTSPSAPTPELELFSEIATDHIPQWRRSVAITERDMEQRRSEGTLNALRMARLAKLKNTGVLRHATFVRDLMEDTSVINNGAASDTLGGASDAPLQDIKDATLTLRGRVGRQGKIFVVFPFATWVRWANTSEVLDRITPTGREVTPSIAAQLFSDVGITDIIVIDTVEDTSREGAASSSINDLFTDGNAWVMTGQMGGSADGLDAITDSTPMKSFVYNKEFDKVRVYRPEDPQDVEKYRYDYSVKVVPTFTDSIQMITGF